MGYILLVAFLVFAGGLTWILGSDVFLIKQATMQPFFSMATFLLAFFIPALTMRMLAQEKNVGTLETLLTRAISDWQVIAGKHLACLMLISTALLFTLPYYITISFLGPIDHGATICGYLGLILVSSAYIAIGIYASSLTDNQFVAFLFTLITGLFLFFFLNMAVGFTSGLMAEFLEFLNFQAHYESIARGVLDMRDIVFFVSVTLLGLILAEAQLAKRNLIDG